MDSRRRFIETMAGGIAGALTSPASVLGANDRIRIGVIGVGARGAQLARQALGCSNTELVAFADIYPARLQQAQGIAPTARTHADYRRLLEDNTIDAVVIATPEHLHGEQFVAAIEAGKHIYQEKTMALTLDDARRMRAAYETAGRKLTAQVGHQACSSGQVRDAMKFLAGGCLGKVTAIHAHMYRNTPHGKPQWARPVYPDMTAQALNWKAFLGPAPRRAFDANRYVNWRFFWDYSGGNVTENLSQQLAFWYKLMKLTIPRAVTMTGGLYLWKDGREVPDTMNVAMEQAEEILYTWDSGFGNNQLGSAEFVLGTDGTISRKQQIRCQPQKVNRPDGAERLGRTPTPPRAHMQNFLDSIRGLAKPNCPFEIGYRVSIACRMAVVSYRQQRRVRWDARRREIV